MTTGSSGISLRRESRCRTASARVSTAACATSFSTRPVPRPRSCAIKDRELDRRLQPAAPAFGDRLSHPRSFAGTLTATGDRLRNLDHMWTAPWQALFDVTALWRLLSYVRPVDASSRPAGHDDIRVPGFSSAPRARSAGRGSEYPGLRFAGSSSPHFALANVFAVAGET